jgi:hypothetical protein
MNWADEDLDPVLGNLGQRWCDIRNLTRYSTIFGIEVAQMGRVEVERIADALESCWVALHVLTERIAQVQQEAERWKREAEEQRKAAEEAKLALDVALKSLEAVS